MTPVGGCGLRKRRRDRKGLVRSLPLILIPVSLRSAVQWSRGPCQMPMPDANPRLPWHSACGGRSSGHLGAAKSLTATVYRSSALTGLSCGPNFRDLTAVQICKIRSGTHTPGVRTPDHDRKVPPRIRGHEIFFHVVSMVSY
jgi:hypothetical protein